MRNKLTIGIVKDEWVFSKFKQAS